MDLPEGGALRATAQAIHQQMESIEAPIVASIVYSIAKGSVAAYYPESNVLVALDYIDKESGTLSYKSVPVSVVRAATH